MYIHQVLLYVMALAQVYQSDGQITDLRLTNGPSAYVGNIEYSKDSGMTWHTTCGGNLTLYVVWVICRHLGFQGANRNIPNSPFGNKTENAAAYFTCALGNQENINNCTVNNCSSKILGAAVCYDERYVGCFKDNMDNQVLPDNQLISNDMTIEKCIQHCESSSEYVYAGVKNSNECYCGDASTDFDHLGPSGDDGCQFSCAGDGFSSCGGTSSIAVFNLSATLPSQTTVSLTISSETKGFISSSTTDPSLLTGTTDKESSSTSTESQIKHIQGDKSQIGVSIAFAVLFVFAVIYGIIVSVGFYMTRRAFLSLKKSQERKEQDSQYQTIGTAAKKQPALYQDLKPTKEKELSSSNHTYESQVVVDEGRDPDYVSYELNDF